MGREARERISRRALRSSASSVTLRTVHRSYYENMEGGHGGTANQKQLAMRTALEYSYFIRMLMPAVWDSQSGN
jgi:prolyl oligopeptidase